MSSEAVRKLGLSKSVVSPENKTTTDKYIQFQLRLIKIEDDYLEQLITESRNALKSILEDTPMILRNQETLEFQKNANEDQKLKKARKTLTRWEDKISEIAQEHRNIKDKRLKPRKKIQEKLFPIARKIFKINGTNTHETLGATRYREVDAAWQEYKERLKGYRASILCENF